MENLNNEIMKKLDNISNLIKPEGLLNKAEVELFESAKFSEQCGGCYGTQMGCAS